MEVKSELTMLICPNESTHKELERNRTHAKSKEFFIFNELVECASKIEVTKEVAAYVRRHAMHALELASLVE